MFQTFAITSKGLGLVSKQSCLSCRRKKKKCDGMRPRCGLCRDSYKRGDCIWPDSDKPDKAVTTSKADGHAVERQVLSGHELPDDLVRALPYLSREEISQAADTFQLEALCNNPLYRRSSVLRLALPLAMQHKPLMHAWIACILLATSKHTSQHGQESVVHYNEAIGGLKTAILEGSPTDEWKRATALLCHAIELLQPVPSSSLARSHLKGAQCMFEWSGSEPDVPESEHGTLLLEAYIVRTALNCLSQQDIHRYLSLDYMSELLRAHRFAMERLSLNITPQNCPWLGALGPDIAELMYRVSWLVTNHSDSSTKDPWDSVTAEVWDRCTRGLEAENNSRTADPAKTNTYTTHARSIHFLACQAVLATLISDAQSASQMIETLTHDGLERLEAITRHSCEDHTLLWPLVILGALLRDDDDWHQMACDTLITRHHTTVSSSTLTSITMFWIDARQKHERKVCFNDSQIFRRILL